MFSNPLDWLPWLFVGISFVCGVIAGVLINLSQEAVDSFWKDYDD